MASNPEEIARVDVVVAHSDRVTLRVGDAFLKVDSDPANLDAEVAAIDLAPIPTPQVLWRQRSVLALSVVPGTALGVLGEPSPASAAAWRAAGAAIRSLHNAPLPPWPGKSLADVRSRLDEECRMLVADGILPADLVHRNRDIAERALQPSRPVFAHGDLQLTHVFTEGDEVTGVIDWSEAGPGDAMFDLAILTLGHEERLEQVIDGYGADTDVDIEKIRAWWSARSLLAIRWLIGHGFDPFIPGAEFDVLRSGMRR